MSLWLRLGALANYLNCTHRLLCSFIFLCNSKNSKLPCLDEKHPASWLLQEECSAGFNPLLWLIIWAIARPALPFRADAKPFATRTEDLVMLLAMVMQSGAQIYRCTLNSVAIHLTFDCSPPYPGSTGTCYHSNFYTAEQKGKNLQLS